MARYLYKIISLSEIDGNPDLAPRYRCDDPALQRSVASRGILQPLVVTSSKKLAAGFKRFYALKALGMKECPVLEIQETISEQDVFLFSVVSNWNQQATELDRASVIAKASKKFNFTAKQIEEEVFPALGLAADSGFLDESLKICGLEPALLDLIAEEKLPFRGAKNLARLSRDNQKAFAVIALKAALTTNQLMKTGEWLCDLLQNSGETLFEFLQSQGLKELLDKDGDRKGKGESFFNALRTLRFPLLAQKEKQFQALSAELRREKDGLEVEAPPYFESPGMLVKIQLKDPKALEKLGTVLEAKRKVLNSLLDIVL